MAKKKRTTKKKAPSKRAAGRRSARNSATIRILVDENPCREGTKAAGIWKLLREGDSVGQAKARGVTSVHLRYWEDHGQIQVVGAPAAEAA